MDNLLKLSDYAKLVGKTPQAVRKAIGDGRIKNGVTKGKRGYLLDPSVATKEWNSNTDESQVRTAQALTPAVESSLSGINYTKARAIGETYKARLLELEYKEKSGQLILADDAKIAQFKISRIFRDAVQNIPVRVVSELAAVVGDVSQDKRHEMMLIMQREIDRALTQLADTDGDK
jgi:hypothetical protein